jgi:hypothetical protein
MVSLSLKKSLFSLLLIVMLINNSYQRCGHDEHQKKMKVHKVDLYKDQGRHLQTISWTPLRIYIDYTTLDSQLGTISADLINNLKTLMNSVSSAFTSLINVKAAASNLSITTCDSKITIDPTVQSGIAADLVIFPYVDTSFADTTEAAAAYCSQDATTNRPLAGYVAFNKNMDFTKKNAMYYNSLLVLHEVNHILSFSSSLFDQFKDASGNSIPLAQVQISRTVNGVSRNMIATPKVLATAQKHFNCNTLEGLELENQGGDGTAGSHWEERIMAGDFMIGESYSENVISDMTLALMEDSGWYQVNYYTGGLFRYGKNRGCDFVNTKCVNSGITNFPIEFSTTIGEQVCFAGRTSRGVSSLQSGKTVDTFYQYFADTSYGGVTNADFCPIPVDNSSVDTYFPDNCWMGNSIYPPSMGETIGSSSNCFISSLTPQGDNTVTAYVGKSNPICYSTTCNADGTYIVTIGSNSVTCPTAGGTVTLSGFDGSIICPEYNFICTRSVTCGDTLDCISKQVTAAEPYVAPAASPVTPATSTTDPTTDPTSNTSTPTIPSTTGITNVVYGPTQYYTDADCFYDSVQNLLNRLGERISYYAQLLQVDNDPSLTLIINVAFAIAKIEVYSTSSKVPDVVITNAQLYLNPGGNWTYALAANDYVNSVSVDPSMGNNLITPFWDALKADFNTIFQASTVGTDFEPNFWKIITYQRVIEKLIFSYNDITKCLPSNFEYITSFDELPNTSSLDEFDPTPLLIKQDVNTFTLDPAYLTGDGMAITFWTTQNLHELSTSPKVTFLEGYGGNEKFYDFSMTKVGTSEVHNYMFLGDYTVDRATNSNCVEYAFVQIFFQKDLMVYKMIVSVRYLSSNTKYFLEKSAANSLVEEISITLNRPWVVNGVRVYKDFKYSPSREVALFNIGTDITQLETIKLTSKTCSTISSDCKYVDQDGCFVCNDDKYHWNHSCVFACPDTFYELGKDCFECYTNCDKCLGPNSDQCTVCTDPYVLYGSTCQPYCPENTFPTNRVCVECTTNCQVCMDATTCLSCLPNYFLFNGKCVNFCDRGYYKNYSPNTCEACDPACADCTNLTSCHTCNDNFLLLHGICQTSCPATYWADTAEKQCKLCIENCDQCSDSSSCNVCSPGFLLQKGGKSCLNTCPVGTASVDGACISCTDPNCEVCSTADVKICTTCLNGLFLKNSACVASCGDGYYLDYMTNTCIQCTIENCLTCSADVCLTCVPGQYVLENTICVGVCPDGYIQSGSNCLKCKNPQECKTCQISNTSFCTTCYAGKYLLTGRCLDTCPLTYFGSETICDKCINGCDTCNDKFTCTKCSNSFMKKGDICVSDCGTGYTNVEGVCTVCTTVLCDKCSSLDPSECTSCQNKRYLYANTCYNTCPANTFSTSTFTCEDCLQGCEQCSNKLTCTKCAGMLVLQDGTKCQTSCDDTFVSINGKCTKCINPTCKNCDTNLRTCTTCTDDRFMYKGNCYSSCPDGTYAKSGVCYDCIKPCKLCTDDKICTTCIDRYYLWGSTCTDLCPVGTARVVVRCVSCSDPNCKNCSATALDKCITCKDGWFLLNGSCMATCPDGYFALNGSCLACINGCKTCINNRTCNVCNDDLNLLNGTRCIAECPLNYVKSETENKCLKCKITCKNCLSTDVTKCSTCPTNTLLYQGDCVTRCPDTTWASNGECLSCGIDNCATCDQGVVCKRCINTYILYENTCIPPPCPEGYTLMNQTCQKCNVANCKTCPNILSCSQCILGNFLFGFKICDSSCPLYYFKNTVSGKCEKCGIYCGSCLDNKTCLKCDTNYYLLNNSCVKNCPLGYSRIDDTCIQCATDKCQTCASNPAICDKCISPLLVYNNTCLRTCPEYSFNKSGICTSCSPFCRVCSNANLCLKCESPRLLQLDSSCGSDFCPDGQVAFDGRCLKCTTDINCKTCDSRLLNKCVQCVGSYVLLNNICVPTCPDGYYTSNGQCLKCLDKCMRCQDALTCDNCAAGYYLQGNNRCQTACNTGFFAYNMKCLTCETGCNTCDSAKCIKCSYNLYLESGKCVSQCSAGRFANSVRECLACPTNCNVCNSSISCQACNLGFFIKSGFCVPSCGSGFVANMNTCLACGFGCESCNPLDVKTCLKCKTGLVLLNGVCQNSCPLTYFKDVNNICTKCIAFCDICNDGISCLTCSSSYFLHPSKQLCSKTQYCNDGFKLENGICVPCAVSGCRDCSTNKFTCTGCTSPLLNVDQLSCVTTCPAGRFKNGLICEKCPATCATCTDVNTCTSCITRYVLNAGYCTGACNDGQVPVNAVCKNCTDPGCKVCDTTLAKCTTCMPGLNLLATYDVNGIIISTTCVATCPSDRYATNGVCAACIANCDVCSDNMQCLGCSKGYVLQNGRCQTTCDTYYADRSGICTRCNNANCQQCDSLTLSSCRRCDSTFYLKNSDCISECGATYYSTSAVSTGNVCQPCGTNCAVCTDSLTCTTCSNYYFLQGTICTQCMANCKTCKDIYNCDICGDGFVRQAGACVTSCSAGYTLNNNQCLPCSDTNCATCDPIQTNVCSACKSPYVLQGTVCAVSCAGGYTANASGVCVACSDTNCSQCNTNNVCAMCKAGYYLSSGSCVTSCPTGFTPVANVCTQI